MYFSLANKHLSKHNLPYSPSLPSISSTKSITSKPLLHPIPHSSSPFLHPIPQSLPKKQKTLNYLHSNNIHQSHYRSPRNQISYAPQMKKEPHQIMKQSQEEKINYRELKLTLDRKILDKSMKKKNEMDQINEGYRETLDKRKLSQNYFTVDMWKLRHHSEKLKSIQKASNLQYKSKKYERDDKISCERQKQSLESKVTTKNMPTEMRNAVLITKSHKKKHLSLKKSPNINSIQIQTQLPGQVRIQKALYSKHKITEGNYLKNLVDENTTTYRKRNQLNLIKQQIKQREQQKKEKEEQEQEQDQLPTQWHTKGAYDSYLAQQQEKELERVFQDESINQLMNQKSDQKELTIQQ